MPKRIPTQIKLELRSGGPPAGKKPKVVLFDIGGVVVVSPLQAILDYELSQGIPPGYINATIAHKAPNGAWQLLERGEVSLSDDSFFTTFKNDLSDPELWTQYWTRISRSSRGKQALEVVKSANGGRVDSSTGFPIMPTIDAKQMFWNMMRMSRTPDPFMLPALKKLKESGEFVIAALSNTVDFPEGIRDETGQVFHSGSAEMRSLFDVFVSSAHLGMRKPEKRIFEYMLKEVNKVAEEKGMGEVRWNDIMFLDDIGTNLKAARDLGIGTIKVPLGKTDLAVKELEGVVGMELMMRNGSRL